jgi:ADP-ribose pyrophosphatase YjhB (NUDIX family)
MLHCEFENGNKASLRHIVASAIVIHDGKVLLLRRRPDFVEGGKWGLPGGFMDRDETLVECVRREVLEESGYEISDPTLLLIIDTPNRPNDWERQNVAFIYFCNAGEQVGEPDDEATEQKWFPLSELPPAAEMAFDHLANIEAYKRYLKNPTTLPLQG